MYKLLTAISQQARFLQVPLSPEPFSATLGIPLNRGIFQAPHSLVAPLTRFSRSNTLTLEGEMLSKKAASVTPTI